MRTLVERKILEEKNINRLLVYGERDANKNYITYFITTDILTNESDLFFNKTVSDTISDLVFVINNKNIIDIIYRKTMANSQKNLVQISLLFALILSNNEIHIKKAIEIDKKENYIDFYYNNKD